MNTSCIQLLRYDRRFESVISLYTCAGQPLGKSVYYLSQMSFATIHHVWNRRLGWLGWNANLELWLVVKMTADVRSCCAIPYHSVYSNHKSVALICECRYISWKAIGCYIECKENPEFWFIFMWCPLLLKTFLPFLAFIYAFLNAIFSSKNEAYSLSPKTVAFSVSKIVFQTLTYNEIHSSTNASVTKFHTNVLPSAFLCFALGTCRLVAESTAPNVSLCFFPTQPAC